MDKKTLEIRAILHKLSGGKKRKRDNNDDADNPLVAYCRALFTPHLHSNTPPDIPFDKIEHNVYNVEGNPPYKMLEVRNNYFEFI